MALSDMFGLLGGGGSSDPLDIYGDLFTKEQKAALQQRSLNEGLLRMAGAFGQAAQPSRMPTSFMGALGQAAGAMAGHGDETANTALKGMEVAEKVRQSRQERAILAKAAPLVEAITRRLIGAGVPAAQASQIATQVAGQTTSAPAAAPAGAPPPAGTPAPPGAPPPGSGYLGPTNEELGAPPVAPGAAPAAPPPVLSGGPITPAERLEWAKTAGPGGPYLPIEDWVAKQRAGQKQTGLLPPPTGGPDQVVGPNGQPLTGPGVLPNIMNASLAGGMPGGGPPFQLASSTPTGGAPPGAAGRDPLDLVEHYESGGRNIKQGVVGPQGGYNPSVGRVTGPSSASGYYQMIDPTWRAAARKAGVDTQQYPTAMSAPKEVQRKVAQTLFDEQGYAPWAPYNSRLAAAVGWRGGGRDVVIPSGRGIPASALTNVADTGAIPGLGTVGSGTIPGLGITPEALAGLNAMLKMGGMKSDPFGSLLETYYKSPGYLGEKARTEAQAGKDVELRMDPLIIEQKKRAEYKVDMELKPQLEAAVARLQSPILKERAQAQADIDRITQQLKAAGDAALRPNDATVVGPGGVLTTQKITDLEFAQRQKARADRIAKGDTSMQPGDIVGTPIGAAPAEHQYITTPEGKISAVPVPGTPAAEKAAETANKKLQAEQQKLIGRDTVVREVDNIGKLMESAVLPTTGFAGSILQNLGGTAANDIRAARQTLESRLSADTINAQRAASPTGAAFGNTSDTDMAILRTALVNLDQSTSKQQFQERLQILKQAYVDAVHGPGMSRLLPETPVLKTPQTTAPAATGGPRTGRYNPTTGRVEYQ